MSFFQSLLLGLIQGLTEFFPVSSSAHLQLAKYLLGISNSGIYFDLICHSGTLFALVIFLRKEIFSTLKDPRKIALYALALMPLIPAYFLLKDLRKAASDPSFLGYALLMTSAFLFLASKKRESSTSSGKKWPVVLFIGVMQTMALIPGISRSGSTISAARICGWSFKEAALFSFLLSIPTILGGELLEGIRGEALLNLPTSCYLGGFLASFVVGLFGVRFVFWVYETGKVRPFAWYCLGAGLFAWAIFHG